MRRSRCSARRAAESRCEIFDAAMRSRAEADLQMETDLRQAIDEARRSRSTTSRSCRSRAATSPGSKRSCGGDIRGAGSSAPIEFIPLAEETGHDPGRSAGSSSKRRAARWPSGRRDSARTRRRSICVNVSGRQFADVALAGQIAAILRETGLDPSRLKLEITESAFLGDIAGRAGHAGRVRAMGIEWSLDDFGTGYSSLSHLHQLKVDTVKIDRSFVSRIGGRGQRIRNGPRHRGARAQSRDERRRGRGRNPRAARVPAGARLRAGPGVLFSKPVTAADAGSLIAVAALARACADPASPCAEPRLDWARGRRV